MIELLSAKTLALFLLPPGLFIVVLLLALLSWGRSRRGLLFAFMSVAGLWITAMPVTATWLTAGLERQYPPQRVEEMPVADAIVVLGGGLDGPEPPRVYADLNDGADRVWHAARLYRARRAPLVVASGGILPWYQSSSSEAEIMQEVLAEFGVPGGAVLLETRSRTTRENALNTWTYLHPRGALRILLVTSATHMRRAEAVFRAQGFDVIPAATDYWALGAQDNSIMRWLPEAGALGRSANALRERLGYWYYRWKGWLATD